MNSKAILLSIKLLLFSVIMILCAILLNECAQRMKEERDVTVVSEPYNGRQVVVIDAGHGGEDGGAVGINGCIEKDINLEIALTLYELLRASDIPVVLTRDTDTMLYDSTLPGKKKAQDLKKRLEIAESYEDSLLVSIHMNSYPSAKYKGMQVYYSPNNTKSKEMAQTLQNEVKNTLQKENTREIKSATSAIYLLHNATIPSILAECGFISNAEEAELLCNEIYQNKMATVLYTAIVKYISNQRI